MYLSRLPVIRIYFLAAFYILNAFTAQDSFAIWLTLPLLVLVLSNTGGTSKGDVTPDDVFWFCIYLYFVIGPCQSISFGNVNIDGPTRGLSYQNTQIAYGMFIVFAFLAAFSVGRKGSLRHAKPLYRRAKVVDLSSTDSLPFGLLVIINLVAFLGYVAATGGIENVLAARLDKDRDAAAIYNIFFLGFQAVSAAIIAASYHASTNNKLVRLPFLVLAVTLLAVSQNPFNTARFALIATWLPVGFALRGNVIRSIHFYIGSILAIVFIFPILSLTTRHGFNGGSDVATATSMSSILKLPFIDVFDTMVHVVSYMEQNEYFLGSKTLAIILAYVPRALWSAKPIVGGLEIGEDLLNRETAGTSNLSFFVAGDLYMDFGPLYVVAGGAALGLAFRKICSARFGLFFGQNVFTYCIIASLPILIRGPLGAVIGLLLCQVFTLFVLRFFGRQIENHQRKRSKRIVSTTTQQKQSDSKDFFAESTRYELSSRTN